MKTFKKYLLQATACTAIAAATLPNLLAADTTTAATTKNAPLNIGVVNFKYVVEKSKMGQQEQASFESLKKQIESVLQEKEKQLNELAEKLNDPNYLDSISPEAETEMKRKFRTQNQELAQQQNQFFQTLQQANFKILQKISEQVSKASEAVATQKKLDLIVNEEGTFYYGPKYDVSDDIVKQLDKMFDNGEYTKTTTS